MNKFLYSIVGVLLFAPFATFGLGVGEIEVSSKLNEPLDATIELIYSDSTEPESTVARLASQRDFDRIGLDRALVPVNLQFDVVRNDQGNFVIEVTSSEPVVEPFLDILIEVEWESGRLLREYVILLDPPVTAPTRSTPAVTPAPEPVEEPVTQIPDEEPAPEPVSRPAPSYGGAETYGPVSYGDTLWEIARDWRPDESITVNQMMVMLLQMNPDAFFQDNVNALREGAILRLPTEEDFTSLSSELATSRVADQNELWNSYVSQAGGRQVPTVSDAGADAEYDYSTPADQTTEDSRLELVPPATDRSTVDRPGDSSSAAELAEMRDELARAREDLLSARQENSELSDRVQELESLVESMERAISLKDASLADLQAQLAEAGSDTTAEPDFGSDTAEPAATRPDPFETDSTAMTDQPADTGETTPEASTSAPEEQVPAGAAPPQATPEPEADTIPPARPPKPSMLANPLVWGGGLVVLAILGGAGFMMYRKRKADSGEFAILETSEPEAGYEPETEPEMEEIEEVEPEPEPEGGGEADLIAAVDQNPDDAQAHLALLRHYYAAENEDSFVAAAEAMNRRVGDTHPAWMEVKAMGANIAPGAALFSEQAPEPELDFDLDEGGEEEEEIPSTSVMEMPTGEQEMEVGEPDEGKQEDDELSLDLDLDSEEEGEEDLDLDLDLGDDESEDQGEEEELSLDLDLDAEEETTEPEAELADEGGDLDLDLDDLEDAGDDDLGLDDLDLDLEEDEDEAPADEADEGDTQFDLEALEAELEEESSGEGDRSETDTAELDLDLDSALDEAEGDEEEDALGDLDLDSVLDEAEGEAGDDDEDDALGDLDLDLDLDEEDITGGEDTAGTKLDLAKAYIDMGDPDGARGMLEEVLEEGSDEQKGEAQKLLDELNA